MKDMIEVRRILSAERACKNALHQIGERTFGTTHLKNCVKKYDKMTYFNQVRGD